MLPVPAFALRLLFGEMAEAVLLGKMGVKPFAYGLVVQKVFTDGAVLSPAVLNITNDDILKVFQSACQNMAAVGLAIGYPVAPAIPHMVLNAFKNLLSVALVTVRCVCCPDIFCALLHCAGSCAERG